MDGLFVTGTGTEVGKTVVSCVLAHSAVSAGRSVSVFKPAVSGLEEGGQPDHARLQFAAGSSQTDDEIAPYRYEPAVSPHLASAMAGEPIEVPVLESGLARAREAGDYLICEGVGGFLVPLRLDYLIRDFAVHAGLPVVIVADPRLGTINHTLLTLEAVRGAGLEVAAVVMTPWLENPSALEESNRFTVERLGGARVETISVVDPDDPSTWPSLAL